MEKQSFMKIYIDLDIKMDIGFWILDRGQTIFDENGVAVRMIGSHTDITKNKRIRRGN